MESALIDELAAASTLFPERSRRMIGAKIFVRNPLVPLLLLSGIMMIGIESEYDRRFK